MTEKNNFSGEGYDPDSCDFYAHVRVPAWTKKNNALHKRLFEEWEKLVDGYNRRVAIIEPLEGK